MSYKTRTAAGRTEVRAHRQRGLHAGTVLAFLLVTSACTMVSDDSGAVDTGDTGRADTGGDADTGESALSDDVDGDGYSVADGDCDDDDATANPGAAEVCDDGVDNDCDGGANGCQFTSGSLTDADVKYQGEDSGDWAGASVAGVGDMDGDGYDDVAVGAQLASGDELYMGAVHVVLGSAAPASASLAAAAVSYSGATYGDQVGGAISAAGDFDDDGFADMLVGAPSAYTPESGGTGRGAVYLVPGGNSLVPGQLSPMTGELKGESEGDNAGASIAGSCDTDSDGIADALVGAPLNDAGSPAAGAAYIIFGGGGRASASLSTADLRLAGVSRGDNAGAYVACAGDVNNDGRDDVLVGAYLVDGSGGVDAGAAYLILDTSVPGSRSLSDAAATFGGEAAGDFAGTAAGVGDVNNDGFADIMVGAPMNDDGGLRTGSGYLILGGSGPHSISLADADAEYQAEGKLDLAGRSFAGIGDSDADGYDDFLISSPGHDTKGAVYVIRGSDAPTSMPLASVPVRWTGEVDGDQAGGAISSAGDVNADGFTDIIIGSYINDAGEGPSGAAYLILGKGL